MPSFGLVGRVIIGSAVVFKIKCIYFLDTLILKIIFLITKLNNFRGDLSDISAKTATLIIGHCKRNTVLKQTRHDLCSGFILAETSVRSP